MKIQPFKSVFQINSDEINQLMMQSSNREKLYHYTQFSTLELILRNRNILLNRIDKVNDLMEMEYLESKNIYGLVFVGCFSHRSRESIPHWFMYTKGKSGVRITFELHKELGFGCDGLIDTEKKVQAIYEDKTLEYQHNFHMSSNMYYCNSSQWAINITPSDIGYGANYISNNKPSTWIDNEIHCNLTPVGKLKSEEWDFEYETRLIGIFRTSKESISFEVPEYLLLPIDFKKFDIVITVNPWASDRFYNKVRNLVNDLDLECSIRIEYSTLKDKIRKK